MREVVLVADGDEQARDGLARFLQEENLTVEVASRGSEVIQKVQNTEVRVVIADVELRGMKGYEIIPILKKIDPRLQIIVTSSDSSIELARKVRAERVFFYTVKPLDFQEIKMAVKDALKLTGEK